MGVPLPNACLGNLKNIDLVEQDGSGPGFWNGYCAGISRIEIEGLRMILKRLATALRKQDWATVFVEFVIVVAGIFVGLQVNEWALERENRRQEHAALERLLIEAENTIDVLNQEVDHSNRITGIRRSAVQFIDSEQPLPENDLMLRVGINTLAQFPPFIPVAVTYQELTSAGQMQLIRSAELRGKIAAFHADIAFHNNLNERFADSNDDFWRGYKRHVVWDYNPDSTTTDILLSTYDWTTLRADEDFILEAIGLLRNQLVILESLRWLQTSAQEMCQSIAAQINRRCRHDPVSTDQPSPQAGL
jgi:hypothetical protein